MTAQPLMAQPGASPGGASPFRIAVPDDTLQRIMDRVGNAHMPTTSKDAAWMYGIDAEWFGGFVEHWRRVYDWRSIETELNETPQFFAVIDGRRVHFVHLQPAKRRRALPLLLLHGWPYSAYTMLPLAVTLQDKGYEVIVPSLPGYTFSEPPDDKVRGLRFISRRIHRLMTDVLGHRRYLVHGGDHGAVIADWLAIDSPESVAAVHCNTLGFRHAGAEFGSGKTGLRNPTKAEREYVRAEMKNIDKESGYFKLQFTRPETITYALADSPVGWAAYMLDKWQKWSDTSKQSFEQIYDANRLITEVMLYLVTDTAATSIWPYAGFATEPFGLMPGQRIDVPYGYSVFDDPLSPRPPRIFMTHSRSKLRFWRDHAGGGHFPMLQRTAELGDDIDAFAVLAATSG